MAQHLQLAAGRAPLKSKATSVVAHQGRNVIHARGLARTFASRAGVVEAVRGVDLDVETGEIFGFLGPTGAGKTTTLRMLTTLIEPTAGTATVAGCDLRADPVGVRRRIGYVPQSGSTLPEARAGEEIVDQARLFGIDRRTAAERRDLLLDQLELPGIARRTCASLSGGQRRRLDIVMGLVHEPGLVFLDEPTTGLDPQSRANLWEHVRALRDRRGTTVFLTTHYLEEADALCDRILIMDHGRIVASGTAAELKENMAGDAVTLVLSEPTDAATAREVVARFGADPPADDRCTIEFSVRGAGRLLPSLLRELDAAGVALDSVEVRRPTLDDVFLTLTGRTLRDDAA